MIKATGRIVLLLTVAHSAWVEWEVIRHAGILWGLFFALFFVPFALAAIVAFMPARRA